MPGDQNTVTAAVAVALRCARCGEAVDPQTKHECPKGVEDGTQSQDAG